jgi:hypothetical protein
MDMSRQLIVAILAIFTVPLYEQAHQPNATKVKADAQNVVKVIRGNELQTKTFCEVAEVRDEIDHEANPTKAKDLSQQIDNLESKLGPNFFELIQDLAKVDPDSRDGYEIRSILDALDSLCEG